MSSTEMGRRDAEEIKMNYHGLGECIDLEHTL